MTKAKRFIGIILIIIAFYFYILSLMSMFPLFVAAPLLFLSILFTISPPLKQNRFKGYR
ncbi:hypothetical protein M3689_07530 [Alkalihalophilus marmarensis]|uniref:hypothetical protein n=1 Tax=Alkalihalophilus marmarensis TaxID=521377 RepID=UPI0003FB5655|nr:hypothetical protein [Alkalihalophilus marmarensis]MCM3489144.1 hypothetical protein [Alkalihalophilus marmarensis]